MSPNFGGGTGTPISPGIAVGVSLEQPLPYTLLSLSRYAKIMGINPAHFWGATAYDLNPQIYPVAANCTSLWYQYPWQDADRVSRQDLAFEIMNAEREIAEVLGFFPAPTWVSEEDHQWTRPYLRDAYSFGKNYRGDMKSVNANWGKIIEVGQRSVSLVGTATVAGGTLAYTDEDSDGYYETATIQLPTALTDVNEIKVYTAGHDGYIDWEIREPRSKVISGGFVTIVLDSWLLIDPELWERPPNSDGPTSINISTIANFSNSVDVYREYIDSSLPASQFFWEPEAVTCQDDSEVCSPITQNGCLRVRDPEQGIVSPVPASYSDGVWSTAVWEGGREPDRVQLWYRAGGVDERYRGGNTGDALPQYIAQAICWMVTARLERQFCACGNLTSLAESLRTDISHNESGSSYFTTLEIVNNPFGTRLGEVSAWRRISKLIRKRSHYALA